VALRARRSFALLPQSIPVSCRAAIGALSQNARRAGRIGDARTKDFGEISAGEFKDFIGENIRLDPINLHHLHSSDELLSFFMGKNTPERQEFIIENLRVEKDLVEEVA